MQDWTKQENEDAEGVVSFSYRTKPEEPPDVQTIQKQMAIVAWQPGPNRIVQVPSQVNCSPLVFSVHNSEMSIMINHRQSCCLHHHLGPKNRVAVLAFQLFKLLLDADPCRQCLLNSLMVLKDSDRLCTPHACLHHATM